MTLPEWRQFLRALWRSARYYRRMNARLVPLGLGFLRAIVAVLTPGATVDAAERDRRLGICRACPFFDPELQTCGDGVTFMIDEKTREFIPFGCQCWMPFKTRLVESHCWLGDIGKEPKW